MANTKSAKKAVRKIEHRTEVNKSRRTAMRGQIRRVEEAIATGDQSAAQAALNTAESFIARSAQKGIIHKKTAARKVSRLTTRVKAIADAS